MIVELAVTELTIIPELNAVNLTITPTFTSGEGGGGGGASLIDSISFDGVEITPDVNKNVELMGVVAKQSEVEVIDPSTDLPVIADVHLAEFAVASVTSERADGDEFGDSIVDTYATKEENNSKQSLNTGYIDGMELSINADNTKFDIEPGHYVVSDNNSFTPTAVIKTYAGSTANVLTSMVANSTYIALDSNMDIVQQAQPFSDIQRRTLCLIGAVIHSNHLVINTTNEIKAPITGDVNQLHDFIKAVGALNLSGNVYSSNSGMLLNKSAGVIFALGINASNPLDPHQLTIPLQTSLTFRYRLQNGTEFADRTTIDPTKYDDGTSTPATIGGTRYTVQHINLFQSGLTRIQYGQTTYTNFDDAKANFQIDPFVVETNIADNAVFRAYLIIKENATNIATEIAAGRAMFIPVDKFGNVISGGSPALTYDSIIAALGFTPASTTDLENYIPKTQNTLTKEPTGFSDPANVVVTGNSTNRTVTLSGTVAAYYRGVVVPEIVNGWISPAHGTDITKTYYLYYNGTSVIWADSIWTFDVIMIAIAKYGTTNLQWKYYREVHGLMPWQVHEELHRVIGTYRSKTGADFSDWAPNVANDASRRPQISTLDIYDEDLPTNIVALTNKQYTQFNLTGAAVENTVIPIATNDVVRLLTNNPYYNQFTTEWVNTLMPSNSVATIWVYAQPMAADAFSQAHRLIFVQPQWITLSTGSGAPAINTAIATEKLRNSAELNLNGLVAEEIVPIAKIIIDYTANNWRIRDISAIYGSKTSQSNVPAGNYLTAVEHDTTLTGAGTGASPLSVDLNVVVPTSRTINGLDLTENRDFRMTTFLDLFADSTATMTADLAYTIYKAKRNVTTLSIVISNHPIVTDVRNITVENTGAATSLVVTSPTVGFTANGINYTYRYPNQSTTFALVVGQTLRLSLVYELINSTTMSIVVNGVINKS